MVTHSQETPKRSITQQPWMIGVLLFIGVQLWLVLGRGMYGNRIQWASTLVVVLIALIPAISRRISTAIDRINRLGARSHLLLGAFIWMASCVILYLQAIVQKRYFFPKAHDEFAYLIQMQMLARGKLWYTKHPLGDFFDSFQMLIDPVYAPMYFPGQAMLYAPSVWLHLSPWVLPLIVSGGCAMLMYVVFTRLFDRTSGILAALLLVSISEFRRVSIELFAHLPSLMFGLLMVWAYLRWRESSNRTRWSLLIGIFAGWSAITRPLDGLMYALPIGVAMLMDIYQSPKGIERLLLTTLIALTLGALPFLSIQAIFNHKVSGSFFKTPFDVYAERDFPMTSYGFHEFDPSKRPRSILPQKQAYHDDMTIKLVKEHTIQGATDRLLNGMTPATLAYNLPQELLIILMPLGVLALTDRRRLVLFAVWPLFLGLYFFYTFFLSRYVVPVAPAIILLIVGSIFAAPKLRSVLVVFIAMLSITSLPTINRFISDELFEPGELIDIQNKLDAIPERAIVLFRWDPSANYQAEPVYNTSVAWPDDAKVIRAHDLGERNIELYRYYANLSPDRTVYRLDRKDNSLTRLGSIADLAKEANR